MQVALNILSLGSFYLCFALGLALVFGVMRVINFAHGELYMLGAYCAFVAVNTLGPLTGVVPAYLASFVFAAAVSGLMGAVIYYGIVSKLMDKPLTIFVATLALSYVLQVIVVQIFGPVGKSISPPIKGILHFGGAVLPTSRVFVIVAVSVLAAALWLFLTRTDVGRRVRANAQNPLGARLQGVSVTRVSLLTLVLGSSLAGISGAIMAPLSTITPFMGSVALWKAFIIIIVGGIGSIWGAAAAALMFGAIDTLMTTFGAGRFQAITNAAIMLFVLSVMPSGLFGEKD